MAKPTRTETVLEPAAEDGHGTSCAERMALTHWLIHFLPPFLHICVIRVICGLRPSCNLFNDSLIERFVSGLVDAEMAMVVVSRTFSDFRQALIRTFIHVFLSGFVEAEMAPSSFSRTFLIFPTNCARRTAQLTADVADFEMKHS
jgi:hypothetical protein